MLKRSDLTHLLRWSFFLVVCLAQGAQARSIYSERYLLKDFRLGQQTMLQDSGQLFTGSFAYTPSIGLSKRIWLGLDLGITPARRDQNPVFLILEYGLHGSFYIRNWWGLEASAGFQNWSGNGGSFPYGGFGTTFRLNRQVLRFVQQFFTHYTFVSAMPRPVHQIRLGVGLTL